MNTDKIEAGKRLKNVLPPLPYYASTFLKLILK